MPSLPWLPSDLLKQTSDWNFSGTVQTAMSGIADAGEQIMAPVGQQISSALGSAASSLGQGMASLAPASDVKLAPAAAPPTPELNRSAAGISAAPTSFALPSLESWGFGARAEPQTPREPTVIDRGPQQPAGAAAAPTTGPAGGFPGFSLPDPEGWGFAPARRPVPPGIGAVTGTAAPGPPPPGAASRPAVPSDVNGYLQYAAGRAGIDPQQVLAVMGKEGPTGWGSVGRFDTGTSYGPLQLHYAGGSNPKEGMGDRFTKATGIDLRTDSSVAAHQAAVDFAMSELAKRGDWSEWYGADNAFPSSAGGKGRFTPVNRVAPTQPPPTAGEPGGPPLQAGPVLGGPSAGPRPGTYAPEALVPNQISEGAAQGLSAEEALAVCGPAAAVAFARANGRNPTLREAKELASAAGVWDVGAGMHGPASEVALLGKMGVPATMQQGADWARVAQEVQQGRPVIIDTPQHYFVASGYDPQTGELELGQSAAVLRASKGRTRFRPQDIASLGMGAPRATIFLGGA